MGRPRFGACLFACASLTLSVGLTSRAAAQDLPWTSATGTTGAGLGIQPDQRGRAWGELGFHTQEHLTALSPILGLGIQPTPSLEIELVVPIAFASTEVVTIDSATFELRTEEESRLRLGAPMAGVSYLMNRPDFRLKVGGALAYNPVELEELSGIFALAGASAMRGTWDPWLWSAETLSLVVPFRIEVPITDRVVFGGDAGAALAIPTYDGGEVELVTQLAPGVAGWVTPQVLLGGRIGAVWLATDDQFQSFLEPYARVHFGPGFVMSRFTLNLDEPLGFAFDEGGFWGFHVGGGAAF